jgi:hypothetical protein
MIDVEERRQRKNEAARQWRKRNPDYYRQYREREREATRHELQVIRARRASLIKVTPETNPVYWEAADGWHGAYLRWRVGPCADYTAAAMALCEAMRLSAWDIAMAHQDGAA